ncbi:hypothetical protein CsatB_002140 [Cannabis sativa]
MEMKMKMTSIISFIVVVALVPNLPSTTFAISGGRALNNIIQLQSKINGQDGKMVTIIEPASLKTILLESSSQKNCGGEYCSPNSPCEPGCYCVGSVDSGNCIALF